MEHKNTDKLEDVKETVELFNFFPTTHTNRRKNQYVRFEDRSTDRSTVAEPRNLLKDPKSGKILKPSTGNILNGATEVLINATQDILLNNKYPSSFVFLSNLFSNPSPSSNTRLNGEQQQTNVEAFIDGVDEYDHNSGFSQKVILKVIPKKTEGLNFISILNI